MGKAGRRKKNRQKRKQQLNADPISTTTSGIDGTLATISNPTSAVQRLRHPDPKIRHASLVALQASVLSQLHCNAGKPISMKVLQAVREQVTSNDLECAAVAAECLAQYLAGVTHSQKTEAQKETTASWALVLLGKLNECRAALLEQQQQSQETNSKGLSKNQRKKIEKIRKRWYAIAAPCFVALCHLIEDNGHALDQINLQRKTFVEVVFGMLSLQCKESNNNESKGDTIMSDTAMKDDTNDAPPPKDDIFDKLRQETGLYAARCLHSALDDNWELAGMLDSDNGNAWETLLGRRTNSTTSASSEQQYWFPSMTRLHLIGCLVNIYQLSDSANTSTNTTNPATSWLEDNILKYGVQSFNNNNNNAEGALLLNVLRVGSLSEILATTEKKHREAITLLEKQKRDQQMEQEVNATVQARKEPAKLIARRQKKLKEAKREAFREQQKAKMIAEAEMQDDANDDADDGDDDMEDAEENNNDATNNEEKPGTIQREQDGEEAVREALQTWNSITAPIQLSLEIITNLVSTWIIPPDDPMSDEFTMSNIQSCKLLKSLRDEHIASKFAETLSKVAKFVQQYDAVPGTRDDPIQIDLEETMDKVSACVVNCVLSNVFDDPQRPQENLSLATATPINLQALFDTTLNDILLGQEQRPNSVAINACLSILAVSVEVCPGVVQNACPNMLSLLQSLLPRPDAIAILNGAMRHHYERSTLNEAAVRSTTMAFLETLKSSSGGGAGAAAGDISTKTYTAILKTFMDWYGNDDFFPDLYQSLHVSNGISHALQAMAKHKNNSADVLDEEQLQILHNSQRFLEYKEQFAKQRG